MSEKIAVIGAFDTKGAEYKFVIDLIQKKGFEAITINTGVMGDTDLFTIDIDAQIIAAAEGISLKQLRSLNDRGKAMDLMAKGAALEIKKIYEKDKFLGIIGLGGTAGTHVVTSAMRSLPFGVPKVCVSTVASGNVMPYLQTSDITLVPSLTDIAGLNSLTRTFLSRGVGALVGMIRTEVDAEHRRTVVGASMFGNTTPCIDRSRSALEEYGFEVLVFHATGTGGKVLEQLTREGMIKGVFDITTTELADTICGGVFDAGPNRLDAPGEIGIPHLIAPGCIDMCNFGAKETVPSKFKDRLFFEWNPNVTLMRTTPDENRKMGEIFAEKANKAKGRTAFIIPMRGFSMLDSLSENNEAQIFWDPEADLTFLNHLKSRLKPKIEIVEVDANVNDPVFSEIAVNLFLDMMK